MKTVDEFTDTTLHSDPSRPIDVRLRISALWIAMLFVFAYVDLFSLYRPDVRADLANDKVSAFDTDQTFLFMVTIFIIIPSLMVYLTLVMRRSINRVVNMTVAVFYALASLGSAVGEWNYFILGSVVEAVLLLVVVHHAWTWSSEAAN